MPKTAEKRNARFKKMSPAAKRVAVARDVLKALDAERYEASPGTYIAVTNMPDALERWRDDYSKEGSPLALQKFLQTKAECYVCAIGAAAVSCVRKFDSVTPRAFAETSARSLASDIFSSDQLALMEAAFEVEAGYVRDNGGAALLGERAVRFGDRFDEPRERMHAIFSNVVKNKGVFRP